MTEYQRNQTHWFIHISAFILLAAFVLLLFRDTTVSMYNKWMTSDTFAHGILVAPASCYLFWRNREKLAHILPQPTLFPSILLVLIILLWLIGREISILALQQLSLVSIIVIAFWSIFGNSITSLNKFPILFLFFAVPLGESLIPPLMEITADFTVSAIRLFGIPVYREGLYFSLPTGNWSVVEACSGIRYLIASVTLCMLYSHMYIKSRKNQAIFIGLSIIVPIAANGIRAVMIVLVGHLSDMKHATGVDHLVYGWLFFGVVMILLFLLARPLTHESTTNATQTTAGKQRIAEDNSPKYFIFSKLVAIVSVFSVAAIFATKHTQISNSVTASNLNSNIENILLSNNWDPVRSDAIDNCYINYKGFDTRYIFTKDIDKTSVKMDILLYGNQKQGRELISSSNTIVKGSCDLLVTSVDNKSIDLNKHQINYKRSVVKDTYDQSTIWHWYFVPDKSTSNPFRAKLQEAYNKIMQKENESMAFFITIDGVDENPDLADIIGPLYKNILQRKNKQS